MLVCGVEDVVAKLEMDCLGATRGLGMGMESLPAMNGKGAGGLAEPFAHVRRCTNRTKGGASGSSLVGSARDKQYNATDLLTGTWDAGNSSG